MLATSHIAAAGLALVGILGLVMGSFVNCWAWRYMNGESILRGRSHCTSCAHVLGARDLVPVASWLLARGRCRYCRERIPARYPVSELACAAAYVAIVMAHGFTLESAELCAFASILLFLSLTDIDAYLIPDGCIVAAFAVRMAYLAAAWALRGADLAAGLAFSLTGAAALGLGMVALVAAADRVLGRESMGFGDVKLLAAAGFYFGWMQGLFLLVLACLVGLLLAALASRVPSRARASHPGDAPAVSRPIPFGPSIALSCVITMLAGGSFVSWYLSLLM